MSVALVIPCYIVACGLSGFTTFFYQYLIKGKILGGKND